MTPPNQPAADPGNAREYLRPVWTRKWMILAVVLIVTGATYAYYSHKPKQYTASTTLFLKISELELAFAGGQQNLSDTGNNAQNFARLIQTRSMAEAAARRIGYRGDAAGLLGHIGVQITPDADFMTITSSWGSALGAANLANAFAGALISTRSAAARAGVRATRIGVEKELANLPAASVSDRTRRNLIARAQELRSIETLPAASAEAVERAVPPGAASGPRPNRNAVFAFVLSLMFAIAAAYGIEQFDRRIKRIEEVEAAYGYPMLAVVPRVSKPAPTVDGHAVLPNSFKEPFRSLHTNLGLLSLDEPLHTILVTSAMSGEGKSIVVRNLALAYRDAGAKVAVVEADFRRPSFPRLFGVEATPGLTHVLAGQEDLGEALQAVPSEATAVQTRAPVAAPAHQSRNGQGNLYPSGGLTVLTSGPEPPNPPAVLATERVRSLLTDVASDFDVVLIDSPPLLAVSDAVPLLSVADGTVLVTRLGLSTYDRAHRLTELLSRVGGARIVGVVANGVPRMDGGYDAYYRYGR